MAGRKIAKCDCGMEMSAPKEAEAQLIDAVKYHVKTAHNMADVSDEQVRKNLKDA